jgi:tetratricopeptide (TPR) repeat protein
MPNPTGSRPRRRSSIVSIAAIVLCLLPNTVPVAAQFGTGDPSELVRYCELAVRALQTGHAGDAARHLWVADRLSRIQPAKGHDTAQSRAARRGYFLIAAWIHTVRYDVSSATKVLERARSQFPKDADLLLASGVIVDLSVRLDADGEIAAPSIVSGSDAPWRRDRDARADAANFYRQALDADPGCVEARMRLAYLALDTAPEQARQELAAAVAALDRLDQARRERARRAEYVVYLLAGRLEGDAGRWAEAGRAFARAVALCDAPQSGRVAQAYAALMRGDEAAARAQAAAVLHVDPARAAPDHLSSPDPDRPVAVEGDDGESGGAKDPCAGDPWNEYVLGDAWRMERVLTELRVMVGQAP